MSIQAQITRISGAKASIVDAITAKGVTVPASTKIDALAGYVSQIETGIQLVQLWANPDPSSTFAAQTLALGLGGYDMYVVNAALSRIDDVRISSMVKTGESVSLQVAGSAVVGQAAAGLTPAGYWNVERTVTCSNGSLIIGAATINGTANNGYAIPVAVYGIKGSLAL